MMLTFYGFDLDYTLYGVVCTLVLATLFNASLCVCTFRRYAHNVIVNKKTLVDIINRYHVR